MEPRRAGRPRAAVLLVLLPSLACLATSAREEQDAAQDTSAHCAAWAAAGECEANEAFMLESCARSCALAALPSRLAERTAALGGCEQRLAAAAAAQATELREEVRQTKEACAARERRQSDKREAAQAEAREVGERLRRCASDSSEAKSRAYAELRQEMEKTQAALREGAELRRQLQALQKAKDKREFHLEGLVKAAQKRVSSAEAFAKGLNCTSERRDAERRAERLAAEASRAEKERVEAEGRHRLKVAELARAAEAALARAEAAEARAEAAEARLEAAGAQATAAAVGGAAEQAGPAPHVFLEAAGARAAAAAAGAPAELGSIPHASVEATEAPAATAGAPAEAAGPAPHVFSIWLQPPQGHPEFARLSALIAEASAQLGGHAFDPHAALIGNIVVNGSAEDAASEVVGRAQVLAATLQPLAVNLLPGGLSGADAWSQDMLVLVEETDVLLQAHQAAAAALGGLGVSAGFAAPIRRPHVPLLYGERSAAERQANTAWARERAPWADAGLSFPVESLAVWDVTGGLQGVPRWREVARCALGGAGCAATGGAAPERERLGA